MNAAVQEMPLEMPSSQRRLVAKRAVGVLGAVVCRLFGLGLIKCMLTIIYLIFRSRSSIISHFNQICAAAALSYSGPGNPETTSSVLQEYAIP